MPQGRILVAEDEPDVREMCMRALRRVGYDPVGVHNGKEAVERARQEQFDLLLTDIKMPEMSGLEAYRAIRVFNPDLAAVVMTGFGTMESAIEALQLGVYEFVLKPFRPDDLNSAVTRAFRKQELERENTRLKTLIPLFDLSRIFMSSVDLTAIPKQVIRIAKEEIRADTASLMLLNEQGELVIHSAEGLSDEVIANTRQKADEGIAGFVLSHREPTVLQGDLKDDERFTGSYGAKRITTAISLPLIHKDEVLGVLNVARLYEGPVFNEGDVEFLSVLGSQAAIALDNARMFRQIQDAYKRLEELDHLKSEFISIAAHELRSPLAVILAYATLLEEEATGPMRDHLGQVVLAGMQLKSIIDEMVSLRHIDTGEAQVHITELDLTSAVKNALEDLSLLAERKSQQITIDLQADLPAVRADQQVLHLILSNLLSNAIKFTPEQGSIKVSASIQDQRVIVAVHDTGVGIPEEDLSRIFQRFYQVEESLRRKHGGIGLGLAIAREMAELIDGRIWAESTVGQGSTFFLSLPQA
jgi:signal transduction histidine kinase/ActR/RegA family two-component response regulator